MSELQHQNLQEKSSSFIVPGIILSAASLFLFLSAFQYIDQIWPGPWAGLIALITVMVICTSPLLFVAGGLMIAVGVTEMVKKKKGQNVHHSMYEADAR